MNCQFFVVFVSMIGVFIRTSTEKYLLVEIDGENEITSTKNCKYMTYHCFVTRLYEKIILKHIEKNICSLLLSAAQIPSVDRSGCCNALTCPCNACHAGVPVAEYCKDETWRGKNSYGKMFTILSLRIYK